MIKFLNFNIELVAAKIRISNTSLSIQSRSSTSPTGDRRMLVVTSYYGEDEIIIENANYYNPENAGTTAITAVNSPAS
jgi:hypothetical protein